MKILFPILFSRFLWSLKISILCFFLGSICACNGEQQNDHSEKEIKLDSRYSKIKNIIASANCKSPQGNYTTQVISYEDGSCFFSQEYDYRPSAFSCKLTADNKGYILDSANVILDTLPEPAIEMVRSHEFHKLHSNPSHFFQDIRYEKNLSNTLELYNAKDRLHNPVNLYYDRNAKLILKIELTNPADTTELIEIINSNWVESDYGKMAKEIEIIQAGKDTFHFDYENIEINPSTVPDL